VWNVRAKIAAVKEPGRLQAGVEPTAQHCSQLHKVPLPVSENSFPVCYTGNSTNNNCETEAFPSIRGRISALFGNIPCIFPEYRQFRPEKGSHTTASTTKHPQKATKLGKQHSGPNAGELLSTSLRPLDWLLLFCTGPALNCSTQMAKVIAVASAPTHQLAKRPATEICLLPGLGVAGDAHAGRTTQHQSQIRKDPTKPNLRQVHLIHAELFDELAAHGFHVSASELGENITTSGIDLLGLPRGTRLLLGSDAVVEVTVLRTPCRQLEAFMPGLPQALLGKDADGELLQKPGVMAIVLTGGAVRTNDVIRVQPPTEPHVKLRPV
jgi:MOSC domain-containing protein YiiM